MRESEGGEERDVEREGGSKRERGRQGSEDERERETEKYINSR